MKLLKLLLAIAILSLLSCSKDDAGEGDGSGNGSGSLVSISASGLSDGKLALFNTATFTANIVDDEDISSDFTYRWSLSTERGILADNTGALPNPTVGGNSIQCVGNTAGNEQIIVEVLNADNSLFATASLSFEIVTFIDPVGNIGCFDQPKIIYHSGISFHVINFDGTGDQPLGLSGGISVAVSPDGEWIAQNDDSIEGWDMYIQRCDGSDRILIEGGTSEDFVPQFSPDSETLYFLRPEPSQEEPFNAGRPLDIVAYDIQSGQLSFLTTIYLLDESVGNFTVSPVTGEIAFFRKTYETNPDGSTSAFTKLSFLQPESGLIQDFTTLPPGVYNHGLDWSPDGGDIIYAATTPGERGIYRINVTDGSEPLLLFLDPSFESLPPLQPTYYDGGARIVWSGQENGQNNINLWSIDANGNDMQLFLEKSGSEVVQGVLH